MDNLNFTELVLIFFNASIVGNFVLTKFLGLCPFIGVSNKTESAFSMGIAVTFVMIIASQFAYGINIVLEYLDLEHLKLLAYVVVIASAVQLIEIVLKKFLPTIYKSLGVFLPLITTNCAILGVALFQTSGGYNYYESIAFSLGAGIGFLIVMVIMSRIREKLELNNIPSITEGIPLTFYVAGILSMIFMGFQGIGA